MIKNYILLSFLVAYMSVIAQRMAISEDSIIKIQTQIFEPDWISYTNKDTLFLYVNEKIQKIMIAPDSLLYSWEFPILASNYFREGKELAQLMAQPPVPIALEKINDSTYLFLGYRRFRSPVTILQHIWLLSLKNDTISVKKQFINFSNHDEIVCSVDAKTEIISILPFYMSPFSGQNYVFEKNETALITCRSNELTTKEYQKFVNTNPLFIYTLPNGEKIIRRKKEITFSSSQKIKIFQK